MTQGTIDQEMQEAIRRHRAGRLGEAEKICQQVVARQPNHSGALHMLGVIAIQTGRLDKAIELIRQAIAINPSIADFHNNLGAALRDRGQLDEAITAYQNSLRLKPNNAMTHVNLGVALRDKGLLDEAIAAHRNALRLNAGSAEAYRNLGVALHDKGLFDEAIAACHEAIHFKPNYAAAHVTLGVALVEKGELDAAIEAYREALRLSPDFALAHNSLGKVLRDNEQLAEAAAAHREALRLKPDFGDAYNNLGCVLQEEGKWQEALEAYRKAVELEPASAAARWNYSRALLTLGHWEQGWKEFDSRLKVARLGLNRNFPQPQWDGSDPLGKTIMLHAEGGHGDALNFIRFVPQVAERGAKLILECQPGLMPLFERLPGLDRVIARGQPLPEVDWQIPLQGLPHILGITEENIPNHVPYLAAPADRVERWEKRLADETKLRVGLVWSGMTRARRDSRTRRIDVFAPLADVSGIKFFSLQTGQDSRQPPPEGMDWADYSAELTDFAETAALVQNLDLVVTIDTSVAHLAGALARPVWVLIPLETDFRWLLERTDSPWYPTMCLFRQKNRGDWTEVIEQIARALAEFRDEWSNLSKSER